MKYAVVEFYGSESVTREADSKDQWDRDDTTVSWNIPDRFTITEKDSYHAEPLSFEPKKGQDYFVVYAIWSTGDSFGHDERACCEAFGVYETYEEAEKRAAELREPEKKNHEYRREKGYLPWYGYFESLDEVNIQKMMCV